MPRGDRTGPWSQGPMTGRAMGLCAGYDVPGFMSSYGPGMGRGFGRGYGRGYGRGRGRGLGFGRGWGFRAGNRYAPVPEPAMAYAPGVWSAPSREDEKAYLEDLHKSLEQELSDIRKRLDELSETSDD